MRGKSAHRPVESDAERRLRASALRRTAPRVAALASLTRAPRSHEELAAELAGLGFDRATVARNLGDLTRAGLVRRRQLDDGGCRFSLVRGDEHAPALPSLSCSDGGEARCRRDTKVRMTRVRR
jgi:Fur family ferric uptake transcriptional regulator